MSELDTQPDKVPDKVKVSRLTKRADFLRLARGKKFAAPGLVLQMASSPDPFEGRDGDSRLRLGFTATKKIGNAVARNRAKRRLREAARAVMPLYGRQGCDYVLIARDATSSRPFTVLIEDLKLALRKVHGGQSGKTEAQ